MDKDSVLHIGTIVGVHGIKGYLKLYSPAESTDFFEPGKHVNLQHRGGRVENQRVRDLQPYKNGLRIAFEGITDRNAANAMVGAEIYIKRSELPKPEKGSWYWCDLIGLEVYQTDNTYIGRIENIFSTGANDVFVIKDKKKETLIPAIESVIRNVDLDERKMTVVLLDGL